MIYLSKPHQVYQLDHCTYHCSYHIVWTPKYRGKVLTDSYIKQELKREFKQIAQWKGLVIHAWYIGDEHIHLHIGIPPKYSIAYIIQILKSKTSGWIKKKTKKFPKGVLWGGVGTLSLPWGFKKKRLRNMLRINLIIK